MCRVLAALLSKSLHAPVLPQDTDMLVTLYLQFIFFGVFQFIALIFSWIFVRETRGVPIEEVR